MAGGRREGRGQGGRERGRKVERVAMAGLLEGGRGRVAQHSAHQHLADQKLPLQEREGYTVLLAMRSWEFEAFASMRRTGA